MSEPTKGELARSLVTLVVIGTVIGVWVARVRVHDAPDPVIETAAAEPVKAAQPDSFASNPNAFRVTNSSGYACQFMFQSDNMWDRSMARGSVALSDIEAAGCAPMPKGTLFLPTERQFGAEWNGGGTALVHTADGDQVMHLDKIDSVRVHQ